jgi:MFS family permease
MNTAPSALEMARNVSLYPWYRFCRSLVFWQAVWFFYFQNQFSAAEAILLYAIFDVGTTVLEVPSGYMSDRLGRRFTLIASAIAGLAGTALLAVGNSFEAFALAQILLGASAAFASGTDSALLYESLAASGRQGEIERQELRAWRFSFIALAISAASGGALATQLDALPFFAGAVAFAGVLMITFGFAEPPRSEKAMAQGAELLRLKSLKSALTQPVLVWLFVVSLLMYVFSHIPFVFGQPFILEALKETGFQSEAPIVSGFVSTMMLILSVIASLYALKLRSKLGLPAILLVAFSMQIALSGTLALTNEAVAIVFLFLRMVPDALSQPFILARIQPLLSNDSRATYISLQSFCGRLIFAGTLFLASRSTSDVGQMLYSEIQQIMSWYVVGGLLCLGVLAMAARRIKIETDADE